MDKKIPPHKETAFEEINQKFTGNHSQQQCARMLQALRLFKLNPDFPLELFKGKRLV